MIVNATTLSISDYWKKVREIQHGLPDVVTLASVPAFTPGANLDECERAVVQFVEVDSLTAAKCLFAGTHRIATPGEAAQREVKRVSDIQDVARQYLAKQGIVAIQLPSSSE
jgi:hypothetical protein